MLVLGNSWRIVEDQWMLLSQVVESGELIARRRRSEAKKAGVSEISTWI